MARFTFGGDIHDLVARPDDADQGALKVAPNTAVQFYAAASGGAPVTDYLVDTSGDGVFNVAATSVTTMTTGYLPDFQGPDALDTLYYDPVPDDADVRRVRIVARDSGIGLVPDATTTQKGVARFATPAEATAGAASGLAVSPVDVQGKINAHTNAVEPHPVYGDAISALQLEMGNKVDGPVAVDDLQGVSTAAQANTLAQRTTTGALAVANAGADGEAVTLKQARDLAAFTPGADVRDLKATGLPLTLSTSATTWTTIPGLVVPDGASGQEWECVLSVKYRAETATGLKIRHKGGAAAVTNLLAAFNPSFESTDLSSWSSSGNASFTRATAGGGFDGAAYGVLTATATGNLTLTSPWVPIGSATAMSAGAYGRLGAGTGRNLRADIQYATDENGTGSTSDLGAGSGIVTPSTGWSRATNGDTIASAPPAGATHARVRVAYMQPNIGDSVHLDAIQLETTGAPLPAYGSTGGSGASALTVDGSYSGLVLNATTADGYSRREQIRTPAVATSEAQFGGLGTTTDADVLATLRVTVTGTGLQNQRIEFECAPRSTATTAPSIVSARATFARVL